MTTETDTSNSVEGRVVIVTGGGTGIGRAYAKHFAAHGAIPVIAEINGQAGTNVAKEIEADGGRALAVQTDVSDEASVSEMIAAAMAEFGRIDVLINNAAIFSTVTRSRFEDISRDDWTRILDVNVIGSWICAKLVVPHMEAGGYGRIINISSSTVPVGLPLLMHYVTSKAAVMGMTRCMASELGERGITCNAIMPGMTESEVEYIGRTEQSLTGVLSMQKIKRIEQTGDLVGMALFLASPASGFMTGQSVIVDGGMAYS
ncbi:MAG: SDR family NAD(P)-dependent oxidoreductase [Alphaproteobacteria bacterium]